MGNPTETTQLHDTLQAKQREMLQIEKFKQQMFLWEIIITIVLIIASYFVLKAFKTNKDKASARNKKYNTGA
ncbi:MAG: hypothetical protein ACK448_07205 [Bacteroidota bacterium]|jgi:hypothetical protein